MIAFVKEQALLTLKIALPFTFLFLVATSVSLVVTNLGKVGAVLKKATGG